MSVGISGWQQRLQHRQQMLEMGVTRIEIGPGGWDADQRLAGPIASVLLALTDMPTCLHPRKVCDH
jgi:hypothetical protein